MKTKLLIGTILVVLGTFGITQQTQAFITLNPPTAPFSGATLDAAQNTLTVTVSGNTGGFFDTDGCPQGAGSQNDSYHPAHLLEVSASGAVGGNLSFSESGGIERVCGVPEGIPFRNYSASGNFNVSSLGNGSYIVSVFLQNDNFQAPNSRFVDIAFTINRNPVNGACSVPPTHYTCSAGTLGSTAEYPNAANPDFYAYQWWCNGSNGGSNELCTEAKSPPPPAIVRVHSTIPNSWILVKNGAAIGPWNSGTDSSYTTSNFGDYGVSAETNFCHNGRRYSWNAYTPVNVQSGDDKTMTLTYTDIGACSSGPVLGCTDPLAFNYNASATQDDGSCTYRYACNGSNQCVKNPSGSFTSTTCNGTCAAAVGACSNPATHYNCSTGTAMNGSDNPTNWTWLCRAAGGDASCTEPKVGVCSATHYNCSTGTAINGSDNPTNWTWLCRSSGGDASCTESKTPVCAATHYNCSTGTAINGSETSTNWTWLCRISGATDASCSEPRPPTSPTNLSGSCAVGATQVSLSWALPSGWTNSLFRIRDNGAIVNSLSINESRPDTGPSTTVPVTAGHTYHWWVHTANSTHTVWSDPPSEADFTCPVTPVLGCTNPAASNYDPDANTDDGSCTFSCVGAASETRTCSNSNACSTTNGNQTRTRTCANTSTNPGTWSNWSDWGTCSAATPSPLPTGFGNACTGQTSSANACGMTNPGGPGTIQCSGACSGTTGVTPPNSSCPAPTTSSVTYSTPDYCQSGPGGFVAWSYNDPNNSPQSAYQVQISDTGNFNSPMYDSGQINSGSHVFAIPPGILQFNTTYRARIRTWNTFTAVSAWSSPTNSWKTPAYAYPNVRPPSQFTWPTMPKPQQNQSIQFTDHAVFGGGNTLSRQWSWNFGDGTTSTQQSPAHTYPNVGNYTVTQTVTDAANQTCSYSQPLNIQKPIPVIKEVAPK